MNKGSFSRIILRAGVLLTVSVLLCFSKAAPAWVQEKKTIRLVVVSLSWNSEIPLRVAMAKGYFKEQGITVEPIFIRGGPAAIGALISGDADFGSVGGAQAVIRSRARGLDMSIIGSISNSVNYAIVGNKGTKTVADLKGKIIGVTGAGSFSDFAVRAFLKKSQVDEKDVVIRAIGNTTMRAAALETGLVAAAPFSPEDAVRLVDKGHPLIINLSESLAIPQSIIATRGEVLAKYPETTKRFLKALILGIHLAKNDKKEAIKAGYDAGLKGDPEIISRAYDLYAPGLTPDLSIAVDGIQLMLDEDIRSGIVDKKMTLDRVIDDRILKQAQNELRREGRLGS